MTTTKPPPLRERIKIARERARAWASVLELAANGLGDGSHTPESVVLLARALAPLEALLEKMWAGVEASPPLLSLASRQAPPRGTATVDVAELTAVKAWSLLLASCARKDGHSERAIAAFQDLPGLPKLVRDGLTIEKGLAQIRALGAIVGAGIGAGTEHGALARKPAPQPLASGAPGLAERLRDARNRAGLSARALDKAAGLKPGHVARIERGRAVQLSTAAALAKALDVRVDWLATGSLPERWPLAAVVELAEWKERRAR